MLAQISHQWSFSQIEAQDTQQVSVDSDSKLPQMACNKESAEKSADPEGEFFDYRRKNSLFFLALPYFL